MKLKPTQQKARAFVNHTNVQIDGVEVSSEIKFRIAGALLHLSLEHFGAIVLLIENSLNGSAAALIRAQFEAYVRGVWVSRCATQENIDAFLEGKDPPSIGDQISRIEAIEGFENKVLSSLKQNSWRAMNSYVHGGYHQVQRRCSETEIVSGFSEDELVEILQASSGLALAAFGEVAVMSNRLELAEGAFNEHSRLFNSEP